jgi:hypothetical protein
MNWMRVAIKILRYAMRRDKCNAATLIRRAGLHNQRLEVLKAFRTHSLTKEFYEKRNMFYVSNHGEVMTRGYGKDETHEEWLAEHDSLIGYCLGFYWPDENAIVFYSSVGQEYYEDDAWDHFLAHKREVMRKLSVKSAKIYGGLRPGVDGNFWNPIQAYGQFNAEAEARSPIQEA